MPISNSAKRDAEKLIRLSMWMLDGQAFKKFTKLGRLRSYLTLQVVRRAIMRALSMLGTVRALTFKRRCCLEGAKMPGHSLSSKHLKVCFTLASFYSFHLFKLHRRIGK